MEQSALKRTTTQSKLLTSIAADLIISFWDSLQIAGSVRTHSTSFSVKVQKSKACSFKYPMDSRKTVLSGSSLLPVSSFIVVSLSQSCNIFKRYKTVWKQYVSWQFGNLNVMQWLTLPEAYLPLFRPLQKTLKLNVKYHLL